MKRVVLAAIFPILLTAEMQTLNSSRTWMVNQYFPALKGKVLYVGVGDYTRDYYRRVQDPMLFETIDFDGSKAQFGCPYKHHIAEFVTFDPGYKYDHLSLFGVLGHPKNTGTSIYSITDEEMINRAFNRAHDLLKLGGTLQVGPRHFDIPEQNRDFWLKRFKESPFDMYEVIFEAVGSDNMIWWGRKTREKHSKYFIAVKKNQGRAWEYLDQYVGLLAPENHFYADPMLFKHEGVNYIFFEDYDYRKGVISYVTVDENLQFSKPTKVLELPCHLSFPYIFEENGHIYMIPETNQVNEVALFEAEEFPLKWKKVRTLVQGKNFADSTLFKHSGYYWLFTTFQNDVLSIYYAESLTSEFKPHPINGKLSNHRNAGEVFISEGRLIRPVMDNTNGYGGAMNLKEIILLTPTEFIEKTIHHIEPLWAQDLDGTHTYNQNEDLVVYDGRRTISPLQDASYSERGRAK